MYYWVLTVMLMGTDPQNFDVSITETAFGPMSKEECASYRNERTHALADVIYEQLYLGESNGYRVTDVEGRCVLGEGAM